MLLAVEMSNGSLNRGERLTIPFAHSYFFVDPYLMKSKILAPFGSAAFNAVDLNYHVSSGITHLLRNCSPAAVFFAVIAVHVDSINRMLRRWFLTHVSKKVLKTVSPMIAYNDTSTSISWIPRIVRVIASKLHLGPSLVFRRSRHAMFGRDAVLSNLRGGGFFGQASATECRPADVRGGSDCFVAAVALTPPHSIVGSWNFYAFNYQKAAESLVLNLSHVSSPNAQDVIHKMGIENNKEMQ